MRARVEVVQELDCYIPTASTEEVESVVSIRKSKLRYGKSSSHYISGDKYNFFPIVVDPNGAPWIEANRYLLNKLDSVVPAKHRTMASIGGDLVKFRNWLLEYEINFLHVPSGRLARPTYRYVAFLHDEIRFGNLAASTAKRYIVSVQGFYRWLIEDGHTFEYPLWEESDFNLMFLGSKGFRRNKLVKSTDLTRSFKTIKSNDDYSEYIRDGGKLRPLPQEEQVALVNALKRIGNTEMTLAFLIALTTGARLQTVFTLRRQHFSEEPLEDAVYYRIKAGRGTLIDTKYGKQIVLLLPVWLYWKIRIYLNSERCSRRINASNQETSAESEQYAFLTRAGRPYYMAESDPSISNYQSPPRGNAVTQFIHQQLKPELLKGRFEFTFRFHDLRATFGMNLLEGRLQNCKFGINLKSDQPEFFRILMYVRERMGHSKISTTESYLNYRQKLRLAVGTQGKYESFLEQLVKSSDLYYEMV